MFDFLKNRDAGSVFSPVSGNLIPMSEISDSTFSCGALGQAIGIYPDDCTVYAPFDAKVSMLFQTGHAIGLKRRDGLEFLIHIGVDTVTLNGKGFITYVRENDSVKKGEKMISFDKELIEKSGLDSTVITVITNSDLFDITFSDKSKLAVGEELIDAKRK